MKTLKLATAVLTVAVVSIFVLTGRAEDAASQAKTYDFKDPKGVNGIGFFVNSRLEPFFGTGSGVTGMVTYDAATPESLSGSVSIDASTLKVTSQGMTQHMHGEKWLNVSENTKITITFGKVLKVEDGPIADKLITVEAKLDAMGLTLDKTLIVSAVHIPDGAKDRGQAKSGDLLVLRSNFVVSREDLKLNLDTGTDKVGNEIGIFAAIAGYEQ